MNWRRWRAGLAVSMVSGVFNGILGLAIEMSPRQIMLMVLISIAKDGLLWLKAHPVESITDTQIITKP